MTVTITLLAGFGATVDGEPVADNAWRLRKARDLVKLLALAPGRRLHREQVMDALWRERDPGAAANNLYQAVHAARRALGADRSPCRVDGLVEVVRSGAGIPFAPQRIHHLLAVQPPPGRESEQLHQVARLP